MISGATDRLFSDDKNSVQAIISFPGPPNLVELGHLLTTVCEESRQYKLWPVSISRSQLNATLTVSDVRVDFLLGKLLFLLLCHP